MIKGLTHNAEDGVINKITKFKGKISAGWAPNEGPNKKNAPMASGFFRLLKQVIVKRRVNQQEKQFQEWAENEEIQNALVEANGGNKQPRKIEFMCLFKTPQELWEAYLGKFSDTEGLLCKSYGQGTEPIELKYDEKGNRVRQPRMFDGKAECPYKECPDYKKKLCKEVGQLKVFPLVDLSTNPYQFTTRSINTIMAINSSLDDMYNLAKAAHAIRCQETGKQIPFDGLFGVKMILVHRKIKSGGRDVFVTQIEPSAEFAKSVMSVVKRGIERKQLAAASGDSLEMADMALLPGSDSDGVDEIPAIESTPVEEAGIEKEFPAGGTGKKSDADLDSAAAQMVKDK